MLVNSKKILKLARALKYAVPAFNVANAEMMQAVARAAMKTRSPIIMQTTPGAIKYYGAAFFVASAKIIASRHKDIVFALHLDHGDSFETCKSCIDEGYKSVMIDGSHLPYKENMKLTKKVVNYAKKHGVSVEAELGILGGVEERVKGNGGILTDAKQALDFVKKTGVDSLAVAIGTAHGLYKFKNKAKIDLKRLKEINKIVAIPLVLHGASLIKKSATKRAKKLGLKIKDAKGVPPTAIKKATRLGISKVNFDSDLQLAGFNALINEIENNRDEFKLYKLFSPIKQALQTEAVEKIKIVGSKGRI